MFQEATITNNMMNVLGSASFTEVSTFSLTLTSVEIMARLRKFYGWFV